MRTSETKLSIQSKTRTPVELSRGVPCLGTDGHDDTYYSSHANAVTYLNKTCRFPGYLSKFALKKLQFLQRYMTSLELKNQTGSFAGLNHAHCRTLQQRFFLARPLEIPRKVGKDAHLTRHFLPMPPSARKDTGRELTIRHDEESN